MNIQDGSLPWLAADAIFQLGAQQGLLSSTPTCGLSISVGFLIIGYLGFQKDHFKGRKKILSVLLKARLGTGVMPLLLYLAGQNSHRPAQIQGDLMYKLPLHRGKTSVHRRIELMLIMLITTMRK